MLLKLIQQLNTFMSILIVLNNLNKTRGIAEIYFRRLKSCSYVFNVKAQSHFLSSSKYNLSLK